MKLNLTVRIEILLIIFKFFFFVENIDNKKLCQFDLNFNELNSLRLAIEEYYYFEFVIDDIPIRGFVGQIEETNLFPHKHHIYTYTHHHFDFHINNNQVKIIIKMTFFLFYY
jgi:transmembrane 9 superfamily protein 1